MRYTPLFLVLLVGCGEGGDVTIEPDAALTIDAMNEIGRAACRDRGAEKR
jgi:hypothetical protein